MNLLSQIEIRKMRENDLPVVSKLSMLANPFTTREKYYEHLVEELNEFPDLSFVAIVNGKVVGYVQADDHNNEAILDDIAVDVEYQRRGIGTILLENEIDILKRKGCKTLSADVHYQCASAIPFYYRHGFRIVGFNQDHFGRGHDAIILQKFIL